MSLPTSLLERPPVIRVGDLEYEDAETLRQGFISAWDIETSGLDPHIERIGTVQVADEAGRAWVVQIKPTRRPDVVCSLLADASIRKLFHFAPFDLGFMRHHWGVRAQNVACTKVLDRLTAPNAESHSLQQVLRRELGVILEKQEAVRRSDWTVNTLSGDQMSYAVADVRYLVELYDTLVEKATRLGVSRLAEEAFAFLPARVESELLGIGDVFAY